MNVDQSPLDEFEEAPASSTPTNSFRERALDRDIENNFVEAGDSPRWGNRKLRIALIGHDVLATAASWAAAAFLISPRLQGNIWSMNRFGFLAMMLALTIIMFVSGKLYRARVCSVRAVETAALLRAVALAGALGWLAADRVGAKQIKPATIVWAQTFTFISVFFGRMAYRALLRRGRRDGRFTRNILLIGTGDEAYELQKMLSDEPELGYRVVGVVGRAHEVAERHFDVPYLGPTSDVVRIARQHNLNGVIVGASSLSFRELNHTVRSLLDANIHVQVSGGLLGVDSSRLRANPIGREAAFYLEHVQLTGWQSWVKRALDLVLGTIGIIAFSPIIGLFALLVKRTDGGPAFFKQQRIGRDGKPFTMIKLRTMCTDAEARLAELMKENERTGPLFKMENDPRFTRVGKLMDATSINELPQLWNVLKGEMSLVGPRPALEREVRTFNDRLLQRHRVKPGITGLWQVESRDEPSFADYERCDLFYVENWSIRLDLMIIVQTFSEVAKRAMGKATPKPGPAPESKKAA